MDIFTINGLFICKEIYSTQNLNLKELDMCLNLFSSCARLLLKLIGGCNIYKYIFAPIRFNQYSFLPLTHSFPCPECVKSVMRSDDLFFIGTLGNHLVQAKGCFVYSGYAYSRVTNVSMCSFFKVQG